MKQYVMFDEEAFLTSFLFSEKSKIILFGKSDNYENDISFVRYFFVSPLV